MWALVALGLGAAPLEVTGDSGCPSPAEVARRFSQLVAGQSTGQGHRATLTAGQDEVALELRDERGQVVGTKRLRSATCQGLTEAAAATLLAWEATLPSPQPAPAEPRQPLPVAPGAPPLPEALPSPVAWSARAALVGEIAGFSARPGLAVAFGLGPRESPWRLRAELSATLPFERALGPGRVQWAHPAAGLGLTLLVLNQAAVQLEVSALLEATLFHVRGVGYAEDHHALAFDPAALLALAAVSRRGFFLELRATAYPVVQTAKVGGVSLVAELPSVSFGLAAGLSWARP